MKKLSNKDLVTLSVVFVILGIVLLFFDDDSFITPSYYISFAFWITSVILLVILAVRVEKSDDTTDKIPEVIPNRKETATGVTNKENFHITKKIGSYLLIDEKNKKWRIGYFQNSKNIIYSYSDILGVELLEDDENILMNGGVGRAVVGGTIFGGVGAVVGAATGSKKIKKTCNSLKIKITTNNISNPTEYITFVKIKTLKSSFAYKQAYTNAHNCISALQIMMKDTATNNTEIASQLSPADELLKFKNLLDSGAITQEEFDAQKTKLLNK